jgi:hypothetical protein
MLSRSAVRPMSRPRQRQGNGPVVLDDPDFDIVQDTVPGRLKRPAVDGEAGIGVGPGLQQKLDRGGVSARDREVERGDPVAVAHIRSGACLQQFLRHARFAERSGVVERRQARNVGGARIGTGFKQCLHHGSIAADRGILEWSALGCSGSQDTCGNEGKQPRDSINWTGAEPLHNTV